jgi:hypothetical protein
MHGAVLVRSHKDTDHLVLLERDNDSCVVFTHASFSRIKMTHHASK